MDFANAVRHAMVDKKMNVSDLARKTGYSIMYVHNLLNGKRRWNIETMQKVCNALGLEIQIVPKSRSG